jgi:hypothetical protein
MAGSRMASCPLSKKKATKIQAVRSTEKKKGKCFLIHAAAYYATLNWLRCAIQNRQLVECICFVTVHDCTLKKTTIG